MTRTFSDGHVQTPDEIRRDMMTVDRINAELEGLGRYGQPIAFTPDDARASRIEREDDEAMWDARLAAGPDVADDQADGASDDEPEPRHRCDSCGQRYAEMVEHPKHGRPCCPHCGFTGVPYED